MCHGGIAQCTRVTIEGKCNTLPARLRLRQRQARRGGGERTRDLPSSEFRNGPRRLSIGMKMSRSGWCDSIEGSGMEDKSRIRCYSLDSDMYIKRLHLSCLETLFRLLMFC